MHEDPAIARVREVRQRISRQFDNDPKKLVEHYMQLQDRHKDRLLDSANHEPVEESSQRS
jgi:hypothetical protein